MSGPNHGSTSTMKPPGSRTEGKGKSKQFISAETKMKIWKGTKSTAKIASYGLAAITILSAGWRMWKGVSPWAALRQASPFCSLDLG